MKTILSLLMILFAFSSHACLVNQIRIWEPISGYACVQNYPTPPADCIVCQQSYQNTINPIWFNQFPTAIFNPQPQPWWATQGNFFYPNFNYPGVWNNNQIDVNYYPGQGQVHAMKPNVYVESIHNEKKFTFSFTAPDPSFISTTPMLDNKNSWKGKIINKDRFEVEDTIYDYLFYDIRLPKEKMQFERGTCATRENTIVWMLEDLLKMSYPAIALQDFEEHWRVKIPNYPYFCIYPQYNNELDPTLPVVISVDQVRFTRSLYVLVPHQKAPDLDDPQIVPLPANDPAEFRPSGLIKYETMFKEWGVAFLGE